MTRRDTAGLMASNAEKGTIAQHAYHHDQVTNVRPQEKIQWAVPWRIKIGNRNDGAKQRGEE